MWPPLSFLTCAAPVRRELAHPGPRTRTTRTANPRRATCDPRRRDPRPATYDPPSRRPNPLLHPRHDHLDQPLARITQPFPAFPRRIEIMVRALERHKRLVRPTAVLEDLPLFRWIDVTVRVGVH